MSKVFQHKYLLRFIAALVLAVAMLNALPPVIEKYNRSVDHEREKRQLAISGAQHSKVLFELPPPEPPLGNAFTLILAALFLSLRLTKRIGFSFLLIFLFGAQVILIRFIIPAFIKADYSIYFEWLVTAGVMVLSFQLASAMYRIGSQKFQPATRLK